MKFELNIFKGNGKTEQEFKTAMIDGLKKRLQEVGFFENEILFEEREGKVILTLSNVDAESEETARKELEFLLLSNGKLEFWETYESSEALSLLISLDAHLGEMDSLRNDKTTAGMAEKDTNSLASKLDRKQQSEMDAERKAHPLLTILQPAIGRDADNKAVALPGPVAGYALQRDTAGINHMLYLADSIHILPYTMRFMWSAKADKGTNAFSLYGLNYSNPEHGPALRCDELDKISITSTSGGKYEINMTMKRADALIWKAITRRNIGRCIAIIVDQRIISAPRVNSEIPGGRSAISGEFSIRELTNLLAVLKYNKLPGRIAVKFISSKGFPVTKGKG